MFGKTPDFETDYRTFYEPKRGIDGVWELPLVLETMSEAVDTAVPLPLPYQKLNADVLAYLEDAAQQLPKRAKAHVVVYLPLEDLVDFEQERERLAKEEVRLNKEIKRAEGMLSNEKFVSKAPADKVQAERDKLEKYTQMLAQVKERMAGLAK
mgnify:CR=1 FL=1